MLLNKSKIPNTPAEHDLVEFIEQFYDDPLGFVLAAYEWGEGDLEGLDGPDEWQREQLDRVGKAIRKEPETYVIREATSSGHGIGKTAETAFIIHWAMSTRPHLSGVVTANTTAQLTTKTWRELALWHKRLINAHWFSWSATSFKHVDHPETWFVNAVPNTEHNSEGFAGLHATHVLMIMDEASAIADKIHEVAMGAMTTKRAMWFVYGNPTRNTGWFRECFKKGSRWVNRQIDSRTSKFTNKEEIDEWVKQYGEDSDFVRRRVTGIFPRSASGQFISSEVAEVAALREWPLEVYHHMPVILGIDVARFGDDKSVIVARAGRKVLEMRRFREYDTMQTAAEVVKMIKEYHPVLIFCDEVGVGGGVIDRLVQLNYPIIGVNPGVAASDKTKYFDKRVEMWDRMREWLNYGDVPVDVDLKKSLTGIEYGFADTRGTGQVIQLESKKLMKKREGFSPDEGDALAYTFAEELGDMQLKSFEPAEHEMYIEPGMHG